MKTKPTQHSVKELRSIGIQPDILICRCDRSIPEDERRKIALFTNVRPGAVIEAQDSSHIYEVPLDYHANGLDTQVLKAFGIDDAPEPELSRWQAISKKLRAPDGEVTVAVVGKYTAMKDAYKSLIEALHHGGLANNVRVNINWIDARAFDGRQDELAAELEGTHAILVPGAFGDAGAEGKIKAVRYARERLIPYFGICFGMQMACVEAARTLVGVADASSSEFGPTDQAVVGLMKEWVKGNQTESRTAETDLGGTMRLGAYPAVLSPGSVVAEAYGATTISERHRHRYEVNMGWRERLEAVGLQFSGLSPDGVLPEIVERADHPWFVGVQYHPELKSRPFEPHPLFASFIKAALVQSRLV
jgi:CTP synthase